MGKNYKTKYGYFSKDGKEYVITRPDTPRPWVNVICPDKYGVIVSQVGGGYSWCEHAQLNRITHWSQDLLRDCSGKYLFLLDLETNKFWSVTWMPVKTKFQFYNCIHGIGYTKFINKTAGIRAEMTIFVPPHDKLEIWKITLKNETGRKRKIRIISYIEWCLGVASNIERRELHKLFIETMVTEKREILAKKRVWDVINKKGQFFNQSWDYTAYHCGNPSPSKYCINREEFIGKFGDINQPRMKGFKKFQKKEIINKWDESIASLTWDLEIAPYGEKEIEILLGVEKNLFSIRKIKKKYLNKTESFFEETLNYWENLLSKTNMQTPDSGFNYLMNYWLKYQAISGRLLGRTSYYQPGGAVGFRDQLQDCQIYFKLKPQKAKERILINASKQYKDGSVQHWWHPVIEEGFRNKISDNLLWLPFIVEKYIRETGDLKILKEKIPFIDGGIANHLSVCGSHAQASKTSSHGASILAHCEKAIERVCKRRGKRRLPLIGEGDWNDGLSTVGWNGKGESVWLGHFLYGILKSWADLFRVLHYINKAEEYQKKAEELKRAINKYGWDGKWYIRAFCDDGTPLGSKKCKEGKIFLNAQTWAVINRIAPPKRIKIMHKMVEKYLYRKYGPVLFYPAYKKSNPDIGYLTRYAPGTRENGGLYFHAACWALIAECVLKRKENVEILLKKMLPPNRSLEPEIYFAEPYVLPGNVDGPQSPHFGRGGWSWYTGSAAWFFEAGWNWIIGFKPEYEGIKFSPCLPKKWDEVCGHRFFRGVKVRFLIRNTGRKKIQVFFEGKVLKTNVLKYEALRGKREVFVEIFS